MSKASPLWRKAFGANLKRQRERANLNQIDAAKEVRVSQPTLSRWERGLGLPDVLECRRLLKAYGITWNELYGERILMSSIYVDTGKKQGRTYAYPKTGIVFSHLRHPDCLVALNAWVAGLSETEKERISKIHPAQLRGRREGFTTSEGRFVDREEAMKIAKAAGQISEDHGPRDLFSEDLW